MAITIRIHGVGHLIVLILVFEKEFERFIDCFLICTNQLQCSSFDTFRPLLNGV